MSDQYLGYHENNSTIEIAVGEVVVIALPEHATTGYQWDVAAFSEEILTLDDLDRTSSASDVPGGGTTTAVVRFRAIARGEAAVALKYWRGYESDDTSTAYRLQVQVTTNGQEEES